MATPRSCEASDESKGEGSKTFTTRWYARRQTSAKPRSCFFGIKYEAASDDSGNAYLSPCSPQR